MLYTNVTSVICVNKILLCNASQSSVHLIFCLWFRHVTVWAHLLGQCAQVIPDSLLSYNNAHSSSSIMKSFLKSDLHALPNKNSQLILWPLCHHQLHFVHSSLSKSARHHHGREILWSMTLFYFKSRRRAGHHSTGTCQSSQIITG